MRTTVLALLALSVAGCAAGPTTGQTTEPSAGDVVLSALGTPFFLAFKVPVCVASAALAAPVAGLAALAPDRRHETRRKLGEGLEHNCGPPYVLTP